MRSSRDNAKIRTFTRFEKMAGKLIMLVVSSVVLFTPELVSCLVPRDLHRWEPY